MTNTKVLLIVVAGIALSIDIGFARLGYGLTLPAMKQSLEGSYSLFGVIATLHLGGYLIGSLFAPVVLRKLNWKNAFIASHALIFFGLIFQASVSSVEMLAVARVVLGVGTGLGVLFALGAAMEVVDPKRRLLVSGVVWTGVAIGMMITAPAAGWTLVDVERWRTVWWISAIPTALVVLLGLVCTFPVYRAANSQSSAVTMLGVVKELRSSSFLLLSYFFYGFAYFVYATFALSDALDRLSNSSIQPQHLWFAFALAAGIGSMLLPAFVGGALKKYALIISVGMAVLGALIALSPMEYSAVLGALFIGFGLTSTPAIASALTRGRVSTAAGPNALAIATVAASAGQMIGPALTGYSIDLFGISSMILLVLLGYMLATVFAIFDTVFSRPNHES